MQKRKEQRGQGHAPSSWSQHWLLCDKVLAGGVIGIWSFAFWTVCIHYYIFSKENIWTNENIHKSPFFLCL
jgi:hypothetical protein